MAPSASRLFELVAHVPCGALAHPWSPEGSCVLAALDTGRIGALNTAPFFFLVFTAKHCQRICMKGRHSIKEEMSLMINRVLANTVYVGTFGTTFVGSMCLLRRLLGRFHYTTLVFFPALIAGTLAINTQRKRDLRLLIDVFFVMAVEYGVRLGLMDVKRKPSVKGQQTLVFAVLSGLLALLQRTDLTGAHVPWLHWPDRTDRFSETKAGRSSDAVTDSPSLASRLQHSLLHAGHPACLHEGGCLVHALKGMLSLGMLGTFVGLTGVVVKGLRSMAGKKSTNRRSLMQWDFPAFLATYAAVFRLSRCILCSVREKDTPEHCAAAGFLAGLSYTFNPSLSVFAAALASTLELSWRRARECGMVPASLQSHPRLVCALGAAIMTHAKAQDLDGTSAPPLAGLLLNACSGGRALDMVDTYFKIIGIDRKVK